MKPLRVTDPQSTELGEHFRRFHTFGDGLNAHGSADLADRLHHAAVDRVDAVQVGLGGLHRADLYAIDANTGQELEESVFG